MQLLMEERLPQRMLLGLTFLVMELFGVLIVLVTQERQLLTLLVEILAVSNQALIVV